MMHKIKVVLRSQDRLVISLPECGQPLGGQATARLRLQAQRRQHVNYQMRRRRLRNMQLLSAKAAKPAYSADWQRVVEDKVRMIEMHAF